MSAGPAEATEREALLAPERVIALLRAAGLDMDEVEITHRRVGCTSGLIGYRLSGRSTQGEPVTSRAYARWASPERMKMMRAKWLSARATPGVFGDGVRALGSGAILFLLPNDRRLKLLARVHDMSKLKRMLAACAGFGDEGWRVRGRRSRFEVLHYKPEQALVARLDLELVHDGRRESRKLAVVLRLFDDTRGALIEQDLSRWRAGGAADVLPHSFGVLEGGHIHVEEWVDGATLRSTLRKGLVTPERVAEALAQLHGAQTALARASTSERLLERARVALAGSRDAGALDDAGVACLAGALAASLPRPRQPSPIHGDLHARQLLVTGERLVFVDFERCAMGDPFEDVGNLLAHLDWEQRTKDTKGARAAGPFAAAVGREVLRRSPGRDPRDLGFHIACSALEIGARSLRRRPQNALEEVRMAAAMASEALAAGALDA